MSNKKKQSEKFRYKLYKLVKKEVLREGGDWGVQ